MQLSSLGAALFFDYIFQPKEPIAFKLEFHSKSVWNLRKQLNENSTNILTVTSSAMGIS